MLSERTIVQQRYIALLRRQLEREAHTINHLQNQLDQARDDKWSGWVAAIALGAVCLMLWANWPTN